MSRRFPLLALVVAATLAPALALMARAAGPENLPAQGRPGVAATEPARGQPGEVVLTRQRGAVTGGFQVSPPRVSDTVEPGTSRDFAITIWNQTGHRRRFTLGVHDLTPGRDGGYADLADSGTAARGAGEWLTPRVSEVTLDNLQQAVVPVRLSVPAGTDAGGHYAGVRVTHVEAGGNGDVRVETAIVAHVVVIVPGDLRYELKVGDIRAPATARGRARVRFAVSNTGSIHSSPDARLLLRGPLLDDEVAVGVPEILPGGSRPVTLSWSDPPLLGTASMQLRLANEAGTEQRRALGRIWIWSYEALGAGAGLLALGALGAWQWRRRRAWQQLLAELGDDEDL